MEDCVNGEDEDDKYCANPGDINQDKTKTGRKGRKVEPRLYAIDSLVEEEDRNNNQETLSSTTILVICLTTLAICAGLCSLIIFAMLRSRRRPTNQKSILALERQISTGSANTYVLQADSPNPCQKQSWS